MNINNQGQFFSRISHPAGEILPHSKLNVGKRAAPRPPEITPVPPEITTMPPKDRHILPIEPNPADTGIEPTIAQIDLGNMTPIEFRQLMHSEFAREQNELGSSLDVMPYWKNRYDSLFQDMTRVADGPADQKMDMLAIIEKAIETNIDKSQPVALLENTLARLKEIDGQAIPYSINLSA